MASSPEVKALKARVKELETELARRRQERVDTSLLYLELTGGTEAPSIPRVHAALIRPAHGPLELGEIRVNPSTARADATYIARRYRTETRVLEFDLQPVRIYQKVNDKWPKLKKR